MSLQDRLDAFRQEFETNKASPEVVAIMHRATSDLIASGQADRALRVGQTTPHFALPDCEGSVVRSSELLLKGPLVLIFYRGLWCPYCNLDMQAVEECANDIRARGASLVVVSPQTQANGRKMRADLKLSFPVLSDKGGELANAFGLRFRLPDDLYALYGSFGVDLTAINDDASHTLPMPARYVIGRDGRVAYAEVSPDYTKRPDPSELLPVLDQLKSASAA